MIRFENVGFAYKKSRPVFENLSLELGEGKICGLLGSNGAGKSTMLYLMSGLLRVKSGNIEVDGMKVSERRAAMLNKMFLLLLFVFRLFCCTSSHPTNKTTD